MINRYLAGFFGLFMFASLNSITQEAVPVKQYIADKPLLFSGLSDKTEFSFAELQKIFHAAKASSISIQLNGGKSFNGIVIEKISRSASSSINIKLNNYSGALLTVSSITLPDQSQKISGRIIHPQSGDVLVLVQENGRFYFEKKQQKYFMTE